jgi:hypothetical protein
MILIGVNPPSETYSDEVEHRSHIVRYSRSIGDTVRGLANIIWSGQVNSTTSGTSTTWSDDDFESSDLIYFSAANSTAASMVSDGDVFVVAGSGTHTLNHPSNGSIGNYNVMVIQP